jgi:hypothetical protein
MLYVRLNTGGSTKSSQLDTSKIVLLQCVANGLHF